MQSPWTTFLHPRGQFLLPQLVYFFWYYSCNWNFYTILHKQISKRFLPLLETEKNSHLRFFFSLPFPLQAHFCLYTRFGLFGLPKATFPLEETEKHPKGTCRGKDREREGRNLLYEEEPSTRCVASVLDLSPGPGTFLLQH